MARSNSGHGAAAIGAATIALAAACTRDAGAPTPPPGPRVVSLSPALSRTLVDLGLVDRIVGRSRYCRMLPQDIPVVGDLYDLDYERLIRLEPTHILVQPPSSPGLDPRLERLARQRGWTLGQWKIDTIEDIARVIRELPETLFARDEPRLTESESRATELLRALTAAVAPGGPDLWPGSTLLVADPESLFVFGRETYLDEILTGLGARNAAPLSGWATLSVEDVLRLDPGAIIVVLDGETPPGDPLEAAGAVGRLDTTARREGRIAVLHHPDAKLPSSGLIGVAEELRRVLESLAAGRD